jgi:hypothetical protein
MVSLISKNYLKNVQSIINKIGNSNITKITVARTPLSKALSFLLNITSLGQFNKELKETPHDKLFHLFLVIETTEGKYLLEKNEVINMSKFSSFSSDTETKEVAYSKELTLNILLEKTKASMGNKFFTYKGLDNNCQFFVDSILKSNGISSQELSNFIIQDTRQLFNGNPKFRKIVNSITDIGAVGNQLVQKADEISKQPLKRTIDNELMKPLFRGLNIKNRINQKINDIFKR